MNEQLTKSVSLHCGDCLAVLPSLAENSIDSCVTDPPYHLTSIVKRFGGENADPDKVYKTGAYGGGFDPQGKGTGAAFMRMSRGFMGKQWDGGDISFRLELWREVYRVLKPGAHLLAFGGTRTFHRMACAIEDAGFEVRDTIMWVYGSGFPKSHDVSKGIDRAAGAEREVVGLSENSRPAQMHGARAFDAALGTEPLNGIEITVSATEAARQWDGWGTALKPAVEPIILARKPLSEPTIAANVLKWGTGALNIDGCRVAGEVPQTTQGASSRIYGGGKGLCPDGLQLSQPHANGRWPANLIHDGSEEVVAAFPAEAGGRSAPRGNPSRQYHRNGGGIGPASNHDGNEPADSGSAARFFYTAKADADDRLGSKHPTVKPLDLMQYLVRLVTPKGGLVIDHFAGTGVTGEAAFREGMRAVLIERDAEYQADIRRRMQLVMAGPDERVRESVKAKNLHRDDGPLFGGSNEIPRNQRTAPAGFEGEERRFSQSQEAAE